MKQVVHWLVSRRFRRREITGGRGISIFFREGGSLCSGCKDQIKEIDLIRGGNGLVPLPASRNGRQLVLLLMLSVEPSLWHK